MFAFVSADSSSSSTSSGGGCFPAAALATTPAGPVPMNRLQIGDQVLAATASGQLAFECIFAFTDQNHQVHGRFVNLVVQAGSVSKTLQLTPRHYMVAQHAAVDSSPVFAASSIISAAELRAGDTVWVAACNKSITAAQVVSVTSTIEQGFFAPQVHSGTIVVNGVVAATYTTAVHNRFFWQVAMVFVQAWQLLQQSAFAVLGLAGAVPGSHVY